MEDCRVFHAVGDADTDIVSKSVESAQMNPTVLVGDDTDLLCLLLFHATDNLHPITFAPQHKKHSQKESRFWDIKRLQNKIGPQMCR